MRIAIKNHQELLKALSVYHVTQNVWHKYGKRIQISYLAFGRAFEWRFKQYGSVFGIGSKGKSNSAYGLCYLENHSSKNVIWLKEWKCWEVEHHWAI